MTTKLEMEPHLAAPCMSQKQHRCTPRNCFECCLSNLENHATQIDTLHIEIQQTIDYYQPAIESLSAQAAHHSAELRRWVCAKQWSLLLSLDAFKEHQDRLMSYRAIVVKVVAKSKLIAEKLQSGEAMTSVEKEELLALLEAPGL